MKTAKAAMHHRRAPRGRCEKTTSTGGGRGSLLEARHAGNSNRVLGLFTDLPKGVK